MTVTLTYSDVLRGMMATRAFLLDRNGRVRVPFGNGDLSDKWLPGPSGILGHLLSKLAETGTEAPGDVVALFDRLQSEPAKPGSDQFADDLTAVGDAVVALETLASDEAFTGSVMETLQLIEEMRAIDWGMEADSADNVPLEESLADEVNEDFAQDLVKIDAPDEAEEDCGCDEATEPFGAVIVALPAEGQVDSEVEGGAHITLAYFGDDPLPEEFVPGIKSALAEVAAGSAPLDAYTTGTDALGEDGDALVITFDPEDTTAASLPALRDAVLAALPPDAQDFLKAHEKWPDFLPHLTLRYRSEDGDLPEGYMPPETVRVESLALWNGDDREVYPLGESGDGFTAEELAFLTAAATELESCIPCRERALAIAKKANATDPRWHGILAFEGKPTGDGRLIEQGALRWDLPMSLGWIEKDTGEHNGAEVVGLIDHVERRETDDPNVTAIWGSGTFDMGSASGREARRRVRKRLQRGVSVDLDEVSFEVRPETEQMVGGETLFDGQIRAVTVVRIPAFKDAEIELEAEDDWDEGEEPEALVAAGYSPKQLRWPAGAPNGLGGQWRDAPWKLGRDMLEWWDALGLDEINGGDMTEEQIAEAQELFDGPQGMRAIIDALEEDGLDQTGQTMFQRMYDWSLLMNRLNEVLPAGSPARAAFDEWLEKFSGWDGLTAEDYQMLLESQDDLGDELPPDADLEAPTIDAEGEVHEPEGTPMPTPMPNPMPDPQVGEPGEAETEEVRLSDLPALPDGEAWPEYQGQPEDEDPEKRPSYGVVVGRRNGKIHSVSISVGEPVGGRVTAHLDDSGQLQTSWQNAQGTDISSGEKEAFLKHFPGDEAGEAIDTYVRAAFNAIDNGTLDIEQLKNAINERRAADEVEEFSSTDDFREIGSERRKKAAEEGEALPDGSYPIITKSDWDNAVQAIGRAKDRAATEAHIRKRARALDIPESEWPDWLKAAGETDEFVEELMEAMSKPLVEEAPTGQPLEEFRAPDIIGATNEPGTNWVEEVGGLPGYIKRIANHLIVKGFTESHAIATAVNTVKRWARGGTVLKRGRGSQHVTPITIAKAALALASWELKKAMARAMSAEVDTFVVAEDEEGAEVDLETPVPAPDADTLDAVEDALQWMRDWLATEEAKTDPAYTEVAKAADEVADIIEEIGQSMVKTDSVATLLASAAPVRPPAAWFEDPKLDRRTALTVTEDGRVYGHAASWNECHIGHATAGRCIIAPHSRTGYAYFLTGAILTAEGTQVPVGRITLGTGHASERAGLAAAMAHYDNTGLAVADVAVGEDAHGIWVAGAVRSNISEEKVRELRAAPLSGDWREVRGNLEMVAALAVNVPGYPIPRVAGLVASGSLVSLVAAGIVEQEPDDSQQPLFTADEIRLLKSLAQREQDAELMALAAQAEADAEDCGCALTEDEMAEEPVMVLPDNVVALAARRKASELARRIEKMRKVD